MGGRAKLYHSMIIIQKKFGIVRLRYVDKKKTAGESGLKVIKIKREYLIGFDPDKHQRYCRRHRESVHNNHKQG